MNVSDESLNIVNESLSIINVSISITNTDINYSVNGSRNNGNFSNVTFNNNRGRIRFNNLLLSKNLSINDSVMNISKGKISIDSAVLSEFNMEANLEFYDIFMNNPQIRHDNALCDSQCYNKNYDTNAGIFYVTVSGFSEYEVVEGPYCGDNSCNNDETCSSCEADCGSCPIQENSVGGAGGGAGAGGGSYTPSEVQDTTNSFADSNVSNDITETTETDNIAIVESVKEPYTEAVNQQISDTSQNSESSDKSSTSLSFILISVLSVIVIISSIVIIKYKTSSLNKFKTVQTRSESDFFLQRSINYVKSMRERGYADEYIKNRLRSVGWTEDKIGYLFNNIN